jgi:hypothetical protein
MILLIVLLKLTITIAQWNASLPKVMAHAQADTASVIEAEEYAVYSALINQRHTKPNAKRMFTLQGVLVKERHVIDEVRLVIIESNTRHSFDYKAMNYENLRRTLSEKTSQAVEETFRDFTTKNQRPYTLSNNFHPKVKTEVISEQERQSYFVNNTGRMDAFFARYPGSQGTLAFSRVGFSPSKDKALVYVAAQQDFDAELRPLWTWDTYFALLTREKGGWMILQVYYPNRPEPNSLRQGSLTVDLVRCAAVSRSLAWGLGSASVAIKGRQGDRCVLQTFREMEGGYTQSECRIPVPVGEVSIYEGGSSFYYSLDLSKHCKVTKTGNVFWDRLKPE